MAGGFIITTGINREERAFKEFASKVSGFSSPPRDQYTHLSDFSSILKQELAKLSIRQSFTLQDKYRSLLVVKNETDTSPVEIFKWMRSKGILFKNIARVIPLDIMGKLDLEAIQQYVIERKMAGRFKIVFEGRLCLDERKSEIYNAVLPLIESEVSLKDPAWIVVVQAFKSVVGLSIVETDSKNFNFAESHECNV